MIRSRRLQWFHLRWPMEATVDQVSAALMNLNGSSTPRRRESLVLLAAGQAGKVAHYIAVPEGRASGVRLQLEAAIPGLTVAPSDQPIVTVNRCWRTWSNTRQRPLDFSRSEELARSILVALGSAGEDELLVLRWVLGPVHRPIAPLPVDRRTTDPGIGLPTWLLELAPSRGPRDAEQRRALLAKQGTAGWRAVLHLGVAASGRHRQRDLLGRLAAAARGADAAGVQLGFRRARAGTLTRTPHHRPLLINTDEMRGLAAWPIGPTEELPVDHERSRLLRSSSGGTSGRVIGEATHPRSRRLLMLAAADALQHLHVLGPTGTGKTTLLLRLICQDMEAGRSIVVIEPRGDLVREVLARVPDERLDDVVLIDPTDQAPAGLNPLNVPGLPPEARVDHLLTVFKRLWIDYWGPRTQDLLTAGLMTIASSRGLSLAALPRLFADDEFRHTLTDRIHDPLGLDAFWSWFDGLSDAERTFVLASVMNKVRAFLLRPSLRRVIGQPDPRFDLRDVFRERRIVLANLAAGTIGQESASLLGALMVSQLWQTILGRSSVTPSRRHPVLVYVDEWQNFVHLPTDLAEVLAQSRGLGVGLILAHQHLAQLRPDLRAAVLANARSRVVFAADYDDASILVRGTDRLTANDIVGLGRYQIYASLLSGGESTPYASGRTLPPPPPLRDADEVRQRSRAFWGIDARAIDAQLEQMAQPVQHPAATSQNDRDGIVPLTVDELRRAA